MKHCIQKIVIVGGGTAGWMTAAGLAHNLAHLPIEITLIESSQIGTVGVGEATIPPIKQFYRSLGFDDLEVMRRTRATCKLGIEFVDWSGSGQSFLHPFGLFGQSSRGVDFHHYWLRLREEGMAEDFEHYCLAARLARSNKFTRPVDQPKSPISVFDWALHFDAALFAEMLRDYAIERGVSRLDRKVEKVGLSSDSGFIEKLILDNGEVVTADLFVDCSGFRALLIGESLGVGFEDWSHYLPADRAIVAPTASTTEVPPYTRATARSAGWQWRIPLQHRIGNGYVYCSDYISDTDAQQEFCDGLESDLLDEPRILRFKAGRRRKTWHKNCVAIGLAAGFLEPLESTSISLIETGIDKLLSFFPAAGFEPACIDEFNHRTEQEYRNIRDFLVLHYKAAGRDDSKFWRHCRVMQVPETLAYRMQLFKQRAHIINYQWDSFYEPSWLALYMGLGYFPDAYSPLADGFDGSYLADGMQAMKQSIDAAVAQAPSHQEFLVSMIGTSQPDTMRDRALETVHP